MPVFRPHTNIFAPQFTVMEVKKLLEDCENQGPGTGGHAISTHGQGRANVTDRNKPNDSAFKLSKVKHVKTGKIVPYADQAFLVCNCLNSGKGLEKLKKIFVGVNRNPSQLRSTALVVEPKSVPEFVLRVGNQNSETLGKVKRMKIELFNINGSLHIHTAFADQTIPLS
jgi:hypothetical protein